MCDMRKNTNSKGGERMRLRPNPRLRPNEDQEYMASLKREHPGHSQEQWIGEALGVNNFHCSDDAITFSNMLYCALGAQRQPKR